MNESWKLGTCSYCQSDDVLVTRSRGYNTVTTFEDEKIGEDPNRNYCAICYGTNIGGILAHRESHSNDVVELALSIAQVGNLILGKTSR